MDFLASKGWAKFLDPKKNFEEVEIPCEFREDPITQRSSRICHFDMPGIPPFDWNFYKDPSKKGFCPFCPDVIEKVTPKFPVALIDEGRFSEADAVLIPNIMPYDEYSGVCVLVKQHVVPLSELISSIIKNGLLLCAKYIEVVRSKADNPQDLYGTIYWNFMPPSGGSLIHPHLQVSVTKRPGNLHRLYLEKTRAYYNQTGKHAFNDLINAEKKDGQRFVGNLSKVNCLTNFASLGLMSDVLFVFDGIKDLFQDGINELGYFATLISRVLRFYDEWNLFSFNMAVFSGNQKDDGFTSFAILSPRMWIDPKYGVSDVSALRFLYDEPFSIVYPEDIALKLAPYLNK